MKNPWMAYLAAFLNMLLWGGLLVLDLETFIEGAGEETTRSILAIHFTYYVLVPSAACALGLAQCLYMWWRRDRRLQLIQAFLLLALIPYLFFYSGGI